MGLDMYLSVRNNGTGEHENIGYWRKANAVHGWFVRECADGVDECQEIRVSHDQLRQLRADCNHALANRETAVPNDESAIVKTEPVGSGADILKFIMDNMKLEQEKIGTTLVSDDPLQPTSGFFFGSTEKDEWYYNDLLETIDIIDNALSYDSEQWEVIYQASW
jgi:hypothetical protein